MKLILMLKNVEKYDRFTEYFIWNFRTLKIIRHMSHDETKKIVLLTFTTGPPFFVEPLCKMLLRITRSYDRRTNTKCVFDIR